MTFCAQFVSVHSPFPSDLRIQDFLGVYLTYNYVFFYILEFLSSFQPFPAAFASNNNDKCTLKMHVSVI